MRAARFDRNIWAFHVPAPNLKGAESNSDGDETPLDRVWAGEGNVLALGQYCSLGDPIPYKIRSEGKPRRD